MLSKILPGAALLSSAQAAFGFFQCQADELIDGMTDFNLDAFSGEWYEITKDTTLETWSNVQCSEDHYYVDNDGFHMVRDYQRTFALFNPAKDQMTASISFTPAASGNGTASWYPEDVIRQHHVVATDYSDYAIVYGCDDYWGGLFHVSWANLLSRKKSVTGKVWEKARAKALSLGYDANENWPEPRENCGFSKGQTDNDFMISIFNTEPSWTEDFYKYDYFLTTAAALFSPNYSQVPAGKITGSFQFDSRTIGNDFSSTVMTSNYQTLIKLEDWYVDQSMAERFSLWVLLVGATDSQKQTLQELEDSGRTGNTKCCWEINGGLATESYHISVKPLVNGYGRFMKSEILTYSDTPRLNQFIEGSFISGFLTGFGRIADRANDYIYTGNIPTGSSSATGVGVTGKPSTGFTSYEGTFPASSTFPGSTGSEVSSPSSTSTLTSF